MSLPLWVFLVFCAQNPEKKKKIIKTGQVDVRRVQSLSAGSLPLIRLDEGTFESVSFKLRMEQEIISCELSLRTLRGRQEEAAGAALAFPINSLAQEHKSSAFRRSIHKGQHVGHKKKKLFVCAIFSLVW